MISGRRRERKFLLRLLQKRNDYLVTRAVYTIQPTWAGQVDYSFISLLTLGQGLQRLGRRQPYGFRRRHRLRWRRKALIWSAALDEASWGLSRQVIGSVGEIWRSRQGSNLHPSDSKSDAHPIELRELQAALPAVISDTADRAKMPASRARK